MFKFLSRSELLSTFFPTWLWQGREWSKWRIPKYDPYYWINAYSHPVISTFYPPHAVSALFSSMVRINCAFSAFLWNIFSHVIFGFIGWCQLIGPFGAITFTLAGYNWKQQPCFQYTIAWFPWLLLGIAKGNLWLSGISFGMIILAGYYPVGIQITLIALSYSFVAGTGLLWTLFGTLIGAIQLIPFLRYLPKTIRANKHDDIGKVPWWHFIHLFFPKATRWNVNGVGFWEMSYYIGIIPLLTIWYTTSKALVLVMAAAILMLGFLSPHLPRIPARWSYTFQFALIWCAVNGLNNLNLSPEVLLILCAIQLFDLLWYNFALLTNRPYSELWNRPSHAFNTALTRYIGSRKNEKKCEKMAFRVSGLPYPLFTGHVNKIKTLGYSGGMQLKLMAKWRNDRNPNGSGEHDWFRSNEDSLALDRYGVKYAFTRKRIAWPCVGKHLYENPRI